jgi:sugar phosphate isomerase/epimerase
MVIDLIDLCKDLGAPILRIFTAWEGSSRRDGMGTYEVARDGYDRAFPGTPEMERWRYCLECFRIVCRFAEEAGVTLALQNHPPVVRNSQDCIAMAGEVDSPSFKFSFDISGERAWQESDWILQQARRLGQRWVHSHASGSFERRKDGSIVRMPLGRIRGPREASMTWNYDAWVQAMFEVGYVGYVNYEACTPTYLPNGRLVPIETIDKRVEVARDYLLSLLDKYDPQSAT